MKLKILQENFSQALSVTSRFISSRAQLPILGNVFLKASKNRLTIASTNLEVSVSVSIGAQVEKEGEITVPGKTLAEIVSNLSDETISLEAEKEQLKIKTSSFSSSILGMNSSDFPSIPHTVPSTGILSISNKDFSEALSSVLFAVSIDETRPTLTGALFVFKKGKLTVVGTDGFRLSQKTIEVKGSEKEESIILPKSVLLELSKNIQKEAQLSLGINQTEKQAILAVEDTIFSSRIIDGEFPNFEKIIPKTSITKINIDKDELLRAVKLASVFAREAANIVKISVGKDSLKVSAESSASGNQQTKVEAKIEGEEVEIAFNFRFLEEFLHALKGEEIVISLSGSSAAAVFTDPKDSNFLHLIMPVRVQG